MEKNDVKDSVEVYERVYNDQINRSLDELKAIASTFNISESSRDIAKLEIAVENIRRFYTELGAIKMFGDFHNKK